MPAEAPTILATTMGFHRVLEIGAATGFNAALLAELTGPTGRVVTIELDEDLAAGARVHLDAAGYPQVDVICGDGALGHAAGGPYDRIIVTAGAWDISAAWCDQLAPGGRIVVPLRLHGSGLTRSLALDLVEPGRLRSVSAQVCGFVPMRGDAEAAEHHVRLADDVILKVDAGGLADEAALAQTLTHPAREQWTGITVRHDEPAAHLDLWLATNSATAPFGRLSVGGAARGLGLVNPAVRWAGAALYAGGTIAYLAARDHTDDDVELGVIAHGPDSRKLGTQLTDLLHRWGQERPALPLVTAGRPATAGELPAGVQVIRPDTRLAIAW